MLHVNIHISACYSSVISSRKILHVNIHNSACYSSVITSRKILHVNIHKFCISVPEKFCNLQGQKKTVLTSTVSLETVLVSACIFHVSAPKPVATNKLQVCYLGTLQGPRKPVLPLTVSVENVMESSHC